MRCQIQMPQDICSTDCKFWSRNVEMMHVCVVHWPFICTIAMDTRCIHVMHIYGLPMATVKINSLCKLEQVAKTSQLINLSNSHCHHRYPHWSSGAWPTIDLKKKVRIWIHDISWLCERCYDINSDRKNQYVFYACLYNCRKGRIRRLSKQNMTKSGMIIFMNYVSNRVLG